MQTFWGIKHKLEDQSRKLQLLRCDMQTLIETKSGQRVPFKMDAYGVDRIKLDQLLKSGQVYHVIRTDKVEVLRLKGGK